MENWFCTDLIDSSNSLFSGDKATVTLLLWEEWFSDGLVDSIKL